MTDPEHDLLLREAQRIARALGETFAPFCEVVVHDLRDPDYAVAHIENPLSGRQVGDPATELGLARINDPDFPDRLVNYPGTQPDGRRIKSTSVGLKDGTGRYVVALCLNVDLTMFEGFARYMAAFTATAPDGPTETLAPPTDLVAEVEQFALARGRLPDALTPNDRTELLAHLRGTGLLDRRGVMERLATLLGTSRSSVYHHLKKSAAVPED